MTIEPRDLAERFGLGLRQQVIAAERISLTIGTGEFLSLVTGGRSPEGPRGPPVIGIGAGLSYGQVWARALLDVAAVEVHYVAFAYDTQAAGGCERQQFAVGRPHQRPQAGPARASDGLVASDHARQAPGQDSR
jgi:hypothetical protein